jgi:hypothetical protein
MSQLFQYKPILNVGGQQKDVAIKKVRVMILVVVAGLFSACGGSSLKRDPTINGAIKALRKIEAATQVGVNFQQYGQLLIEAKVQVNEALEKLPDGELKNELKAAIEAYFDARQVWSNKIQSKMVLLDTEPGKTVIPKYSLRTTKESLGRLETDPDQAMQTIWRAAKDHLDRVASLLQK